jgi:NADH dehydrogenase/NADH:ubiquinone oxidoreductase subunit G
LAWQKLRKEEIVADKIKLTIDDQAVSVAPDTTILDAARQAGIEIPTLCYLERLTANGLCRLCLVEIEGMKGLHASCVTKVQQDAVIHTRSENVMRARRTILEMLAASVDLSESPDLQHWMDEYGAHPERFKDAVRRDPQPIDDNPVYLRDYAKCVMCWRCVQICADDAQYNFAINFAGRGFHTSVATYFELPLTETRCVFCGNCVGVCPTGALKAKREALIEKGLSTEEVFALTRQEGKRMRTRMGPRISTR